MGYLDAIGSCNCHHRQDADITRGYLGWYENLNEVLKRYPTPRIGWSFNNVDTRSVWIYDGRRWCNTTQGNPFTMITDVNNAGAMRNGYAQTFYYIPTKADVNGGTITFRFDVEGKERFCDVDVWSISDIVFVEWTGSTINTSVHQLDDSVVKHVEQTLNEEQKLQARENIGAIGSEQVTNELNGLQYDVLQKGGGYIYPLTTSYNVKHMNTTVNEAIEKLKEKDKNLDETVVKHIAQSLTEAQKLQAQINIGAVSKAEEEDHMLWQGRIYYPETTTEYVRVPGENKNLATLLTELSSILNGVVKDVETFLSDADVSESAKDTLRELQEYINQDVAAAAEMLASINKLKTEKVDVAGGNVTNTVVELGGDLTPLGEALESVAVGFNEIAIAQGEAAARIDHIEKEDVKNKENIRTLAEQKAEKEGTYPNLTSGFADNLVGRGEATPEVFTFRQSGGNTSINDGTARLKSIKGNSVVFNQQLRNTLDIKGKEGWRVRIGEHNCIIEGNSITLLINTDTSTTTLIGQYANFIKGHIYMHLMQYNVGQITNMEDRTVYIGARQSVIDGGIPVYERVKYINSNESGNFNGIFVCSDDTVQAFSLFISNCEKDIGESITFTNIQLIDLTAMFGVGYEPQTVEEFRALYPKDYYEYNAGEIINSNYTAIESVGFNAFDGEKADVIGGKVYELLGNYTSIGFTSVIGGELTTIEIPEDKHYTPNQNGYIYAVGSDVCIHLCHTGYKDGKYEPYRKDAINLPNIELKKAGNVYDEVRYNPNSEKWEYVQRVGSVDMGELNWGYYSNLFITTYNGVKRINQYPYGNYVNSINSAGYVNSLKGDLHGKNKDIAVNYAQYSYNTIVIVDTSYTDAASFKEAMKGQILHYELAEPIITELEGDYSTDYIVSDFGTEKAITDKLCAPFSADIIYQFNAVDRIRENSAKIAQLEALIVELNSKLLAQEAESINNINIEEE